MSHIVKLALAGVALFATASVPALAADLYVPPVVEYEPPVINHGGWYLRGHIGMSNQRFDGLDYEYFSGLGAFGWHDEGGFDSAPLFGIGAGYQFNDWFRADITAEYRGKSDFHALDFYDVDGTPGTGDEGTNDYHAKKSELLFLANGYVDIGNFYGVTPYVGAGIGASRNTISHFTDTNVMASGGGYAEKDSKWDLAWALHAGVGFQATERLTLDLGYSYVNLGDATTGQAHNYDPDETRPNDGFKFEDLASHDFKLGLRYSFN